MLSLYSPGKLTNKIAQLSLIGLRSEVSQGYQAPTSTTIPRLRNSGTAMKSDMLKSAITTCTLYRLNKSTSQSKWLVNFCMPKTLFASMLWTWSTITTCRWPEAPAARSSVTRAIRHRLYALPRLGGLGGSFVCFCSLSRTWTQNGAPNATTRGHCPSEHERQATEMFPHNLLGSSTRKRPDLRSARLATTAANYSLASACAPPIGHCILRGR